MAMIKKEVTGDANALKLVADARQAPVAAKGGTQRTSFTGSNDTRPAGDDRPNRKLKAARGYVDQGPVTMDVANNYGAQFVNGGPTSGSVNKKYSAASESVTGGMGGKVIKNMK